MADCLAAAKVAFCLIVGGLIPSGLLNCTSARAESGIASHYGYARRTASGEPFRSGALTAAHKTLPFGTRVQVTNNRNGRVVIVRINDRGPFKHGRVIDLTTAGARTIGLSGVAPVTLTVLQ